MHVKLRSLSVGVSGCFRLFQLRAYDFTGLTTETIFRSVMKDESFFDITMFYWSFGVTNPVVSHSKPLGGTKEC